MCVLFAGDALLFMIFVRVYSWVDLLDCCLFDIWVGFGWFSWPCIVGCVGDFVTFDLVIWWVWLIDLLLFWLLFVLLWFLFVLGVFVLLFCFVVFWGVFVFSFD